MRGEVCVFEGVSSADTGVAPVTHSLIGGARVITNTVTFGVPFIMFSVKYINQPDT